MILDIMCDIYKICALENELCKKWEKSNRVAEHIMTFQVFAAIV